MQFELEDTIELNVLTRLTFVPCLLVILFLLITIELLVFLTPACLTPAGRALAFHILAVHTKPQVSS